jgi:N-acetylglucosamine kinase-like BadF-type ATPase
VRASRQSGQRDNNTWRIGVDLGGTWIRVLAADARGRPRSITARSPGLAGLPPFLGRLWRRWALARADVDVLVVASRGVWTRAERSGQARRLRALARHVRVISDTEAAYRGALGDTPGMLLLAGTGSMALGRDRRGRWARAGGLGPLLGDEGSAFWIGREWLRSSTRARGFLAARRLLRSPDPVARIAAGAPAVLRRARVGSSPCARAIVTRAQGALADLLVTTARRLRLRPPIAVSWSGSLLDVADYRAGVWRAARQRGLILIPRPACESAVQAALRLAQARRSRPADPD